MRRLVGGIFWWLTLLSLYMLLVGKNEPAEWGAGGIAAGLGTAAIAVVSSRRKTRFAPRLAWIVHARSLPGQILTDCWNVTAELWRLLRGRPRRDRFRLVPFDAGGQDEVSAARRALVILGVSLGPNSDVIAIDNERGTLLIHQLAPTREPPGHDDREWPL